MSSGRRIPQNTAEYARWLAAEISRRYRPTWFEPDTAMFLAMALEGYASWLDQKEAKGLSFTVTASTISARHTLSPWPTMLRSLGPLTAPQSRNKRARIWCFIRRRG